MSQGAFIAGSVTAAVGLGAFLCVAGCCAGYINEKRAARMNPVVLEKSASVFCDHPLPLCCDIEVSLCCCPCTLSWLLGRSLYKTGEKLGKQIYQRCQPPLVAPVHQYLLGENNGTYGSIQRFEMG